MAGGGAERQLAYIVQCLVGRGWDVHVAVVFPGPHDARLHSSGGRVHRLGGRGRFDPAIAWRLGRLMRRVRPVLAQTWLTPMDIVGGAVATALRVPWILSERSGAEAYPPSLLHRVRARIGQQATGCIANSAAGAEYWRRMGVDAARIRVVPNAVPLDAIDAAPAAPRADGEALIVYVGRLSPEKNLPLLLDALALLMRRRPARAVLCGDGRLREALQSRAAALGIADRVTLAG